MSLDDVIFKIPLTYRNVLPRIWFLNLYKTKYLEKGYAYPFSGKLKEQYNLLQQTINNPPDGASQRLHKDKCTYCGVDWPFNGQGDHVISKTRYLHHRELNNLLYRVTCCTRCNSSKLNKDLLFWLIVKKNREPLKINHDVITVYCKAEYLCRKLENTLDDNVPGFFIDVIKKLHFVINDSSYYEIWNPFQARLQR